MSDMSDSAPAELVREYGPYAGAGHIHGITHDGTHLWAATGAKLIAMDSGEAEARLVMELPGKDSPEADYDRAWALTLLDRVTEQVREECEADGHAGRFEVLRSFINGARGDVPLAEAAERLGVSQPAMKSIVHRLRKRFRERLLAEIRETVTSEEEAAAELQFVFTALSQ